MIVLTVLQGLDEHLVKELPSPLLLQSVCGLLCSQGLNNLIRKARADNDHGSIVHFCDIPEVSDAIKNGGCYRLFQSHMRVVFAELDQEVDDNDHVDEVLVLHGELAHALAGLDIWQLDQELVLDEEAQRFPVFRGNQFLEVIGRQSQKAVVRGSI